MPDAEEKRVALIRAIQAVAYNHGLVVHARVSTPFEKPEHSRILAATILIAGDSWRDKITVAHEIHKLCLRQHVHCTFL